MRWALAYADPDDNGEARLRLRPAERGTRYRGHRDFSPQTSSAAPAGVSVEVHRRHQDSRMLGTASHSGSVDEAHDAEILLCLLVQSVTGSLKMQSVAE